MTSLLDKLSNACHYLESDKASERKKYLEDVKNLLHNTELLNALEKSSKGKKGLTYTKLFRTVHGCLMTECDVILNKFDEVDISISKKHHIHAIANVSKQIVHISFNRDARHKGRPKISIKDVISSILFILKRSCHRQLCGSIYLSIFIDEILRNQRFLTCISPQQYKDVLVWMTSSYLDGDLKGFLEDRHFFDSMTSVLSCASQISSPNLFYFLFPFFTDIFERSAGNQSMGYKEQLYKILLSFSTWQLQANPHTLHVLGSKILLHISQLLSNKSTSSRVIQYACKFCFQQIEICEAHVVNDTKRIWKTDVISLISLWKMLLLALSNYFANNSTSNKICEVSISLFGRIFGLLISLHTSSGYDVTQDDNEEYADEKIVAQLSFKNWIEILKFLPQSSTNNKLTCIWLKVITSSCFDESGEGLSFDDVTACASHMHHLMCNCKSNEVIYNLMICLQHLINCQQSSTASAGVQMMNEKMGTWKDIWDKTCRFVHLAFSAEKFDFSCAIFNLLSQLLKLFHSVSSWHFEVNFSQGILPLLLCSKPDKSNVRFLNQLIEYHGTKELFAAHSASDEGKIINWLLQCSQKEIATSNEICTYSRPQIIPNNNDGPVSDWIKPVDFSNLILRCYYPNFSTRQNQNREGRGPIAANMNKDILVGLSEVISTLVKNVQMKIDDNKDECCSIFIIHVLLHLSSNFSDERTTDDLLDVICRPLVARLERNCPMKLLEMLVGMLRDGANITTNHHSVLSMMKQINRKVSAMTSQLLEASSSEDKSSCDLNFEDVDEKNSSRSMEKKKTNFETLMRFKVLWLKEANNIDELEEDLKQFNFGNAYHCQLFFILIEEIFESNLLLSVKVMGRLTNNLTKILQFHYIDFTFAFQSLASLMHILEMSTKLMTDGGEEHLLAENSQDLFQKFPYFEDVIFLLETFHNEMKEESCSENKKYFIKCLFFLSKCFSCQNNKKEKNDFGTKLDIVKKILDFVSDEDYDVTTQVCDVMKLLFAEDDGQVMSEERMEFEREIFQIVIKKWKSVSIRSSGNDGLGIYYHIFSYLQILCAMSPYSGHFLEMKVLARLCVICAEINKQQENELLVEIFHSAWKLSHLRSDAGELRVKVGNNFSAIAHHWSSKVVDILHDFPHRLAGFDTEEHFRHHHLCDVITCDLYERKLEVETLQVEMLDKLVTQLIVASIYQGFDNNWEPRKIINKFGLLLKKVTDVFPNHRIQLKLLLPEVLTKMLFYSHWNDSHQKLLDEMFEDILGSVVEMCGYQPSNNQANIVSTMLKILNNLPEGMLNLSNSLYQHLYNVDNIYQNRHFLVSFNFILNRIFPVINDMMTSLSHVNGLVNSIVFILVHQLNHLAAMITEANERSLNEMVMCVNIIIHSFISLFIHLSSMTVVLNNARITGEVVASLLHIKIKIDTCTRTVDPMKEFETNFEQLITTIVDNRDVGESYLKFLKYDPSIISATNDTTELDEMLGVISTVCNIYRSNDGYDDLLGGILNKIRTKLDRVQNRKQIEEILKILIKVQRLYQQAPDFLVDFVQDLDKNFFQADLIYSLRDWTTDMRLDFLPSLLHHLFIQSTHHLPDRIQVSRDTMRNLTTFEPVNKIIRKLSLLSSNELLVSFVDMFRTTQKEGKRKEAKQQVDNVVDDWLIELTCYLIDINKIDYVTSLLPLCRSDKEVCWIVLPFLFTSVLSIKTLSRQNVVEKVNNFLSEAIKDGGRGEKLRIESVVKMLRLIEFVRQFHIRYDDNDDQLIEMEVDVMDGIDLLSLSKAAVICGEEILSLLYLELFLQGPFLSDASLTNKSLHDDYIHGNKLILNLLHISSNKNDIDVMKLLDNCLSGIGDNEGLRSLFSYQSYDCKKLTELYEIENSWSEVLYQHDLSVSMQSSPLPNNRIVEALQNCSLDHVTSIYKNAVRNDEKNSEWKYEMAWKTGSWDVKYNAGEEHFHGQIYNTLHSLHQHDRINMEDHLHKATRCCLNMMSERNHFIPNENLQEILFKLKALKDVNNVSQRLFSQSSDVNLFAEFDENQSWQEFEFRSKVKTSLFNICAKGQVLTNEEKKELDSRHENYLFDSLSVMRGNDKLHEAQKTLLKLTEISKMKTQCSWKVQLQFENAQQLWFKKEEKLAISLLTKINQSLSSIIVQMNRMKNERKIVEINRRNKLLLAKCLRTLGVWFSDSHLQGPHYILEDCFKPAVQLAEMVQKATKENSNLQTVVECYHCLALFADNQYQQVKKYKISPEYLLKRKLACAYTEELKNRKKSGASFTQRTKTIVEKNYNIDRTSFNKTEEKLISFLDSATSNYTSCLHLSSQYDLVIYRLCTLWFENSSDVIITKSMTSAFSKVKTHKFLPLGYQLSARLSNEDNGFQRILKKILFNLCKAHLNEVLPIILSLVNATKDEELEQPPPKKKSKNAKGLSPRAEAASQILFQIGNFNYEEVTSLKLMTDLLIEFANFDASAWKNKPLERIGIPPKVRLAKLCDPKDELCRQLQHLPLHFVSSTNHIMPTFVRFKPYFQTVGGLNLPKVLNVVTSDGGSKKILLKGKDDLHQDAVMQQVFETVNKLLRTNAKTKELRMRTYKVTPLSQRSGVLEWCEGTTSIGNYLIGSPSNPIGAHSRYYPEDWMVKKCRQELHVVRGQPLKVKQAKFLEICENLHPVFHHFFMENFLEPNEWFVKRRVYTQSVAVSSMIGYIVGLGDRHVQNVLIDYSTGEIIHIDLGVAFEQGLCLPTPETIPFRLTRDLLDGMGVMGYEGHFTRSCERTMELMRSSSHVVSTIVEVLLYDPLYDWTISPIQNQQKRMNLVDSNDMGAKNPTEDQQQETNKLAERALLRLQDKLRGKEDGSSLSINGQVNMLIQQASDPQLLCQLFAGWQPYL